MCVAQEGQKNHVQGEDRHLIPRQHRKVEQLFPCSTCTAGFNPMQLHPPWHLGRSRLQHTLAARSCT